ncbi:uncharacterized protein LOC128203217 isoform X1 [Mya arenaria]|uniref:uncharacterized protein LOC128203217 isoform X1 n=2 Tax=Mya arenaria TaxID=6604 RepID=UPI0022E4FF3B|nr:uncharacterized protein LOC128203217 isoform X1 [Mya arenaria]
MGGRCFPMRSYEITQMEKPSKKLCLKRKRSKASVADVYVDSEDVVVADNETRPGKQQVADLVTVNPCLQKLRSILLRISPPSRTEKCTLFPQYVQDVGNTETPKGCGHKFPPPCCQVSWSRLNKNGGIGVDQTEPSGSNDNNKHEPGPSGSNDNNKHEPGPSGSNDNNKHEPGPSGSNDNNKHEPGPCGSSKGKEDLLQDSEGPRDRQSSSCRVGGSRSSFVTKKTSKSTCIDDWRSAGHTDASDDLSSKFLDLHDKGDPFNQNHRCPNICGTESQQSEGSARSRSGFSYLTHAPVRSTSHLPQVKSARTYVQDLTNSRQKPVYSDDNSSIMMDRNSNLYCMQTKNVNLLA